MHTIRRDKWLFILMLLLLSLDSFAQLKTAKPVKLNVNPNTAYRPPYFADTARLGKVRVLFPAIEKIYAAYAAKNHFPGYAFGIVLDGQLVFTGSGGYTDIAKKIT